MTLVKNALKQYFDNSPPAQTPQEHARVWSDTQERIKTLLGYDRLNQYQEQLATSGTNSDPAALFQSSP
jgi:hypothetical protein